MRCRECWACKNADETEKISLREEQENQLVRESVHLNFDSKSIDCTLPVRGDEADFLSTNRFMHQLTDEEKEQFTHKDPQYFIPWRVVFADSVTTPCRPVPVKD